MDQVDPSNLTPFKLGIKHRNKWLNAYKTPFLTWCKWWDGYWDVQTC